MSGKNLRHGYTTGACAAAAAKGAALMLRDRQPVAAVELLLPAGMTAAFHLNSCELQGGTAICSVIKDAGDDPDVTNGAEIRAELSLVPGENGSIVVAGGEGVGRVTKPGLAVAVGDWAINPIPRRMIEAAVREVFPPDSSPLTPHVVVSIPNGGELAKKTLNARLGIIGGLSILGTTGIVRPISAKAWTDTIDASIDVALACGSRTVVLSTGRTSEMVAQRYFGTGDWDPRGPKGPGNGNPLKEEAFVMMGDHVGYALRACARKGVGRAVLAGQFAKLLKIACCHEQTHVTSSELDLRALASWLAETPHSSLLTSHVREANTARQVLEMSGDQPALVALVCSHAAAFARQVTPTLPVTVLLAGYGGEVLYCA
ncbi:cobalt-precorrin-5B (C(1))-methyltransferase [Geobacter argillaceus]|uniref:Cobalt-precorrin-5B C(1)-methyltransferase n=1 Tax=Geobacter argillaceus TaxID=345631 RepID=A0A562VJJ6_9BACT|nr:cobalt-precorrin-5B (C(1))-methyltransferase [Geobacter argillaceus]TWJ17991.1 cobalt-precorrin-5B (C1)-methyltransferase [Geobacter argillaceus]